MAHYELNILDYWRILRKRKTIVVLTTDLVGVITFMTTLIMKPRPLYEATASVKVERVTTMAGLFTEVFTYPSGDNLATQALVIKGFPVLEKVAKSLKLIPSDIPSERVMTSEAYLRILADLQSRITTEQEGNTNIINVTAVADSPREAKDIANLVVEKYREESILSRNRQVFEAKRFIEDQLKEVDARLKESEERLNTFKEAHDVVSLTDEQRILLERFSSLEGERDKTLREVKEVQYQMDLLRGGKAIPPERMGRIFTGEETSPIGRLNVKLSELLIERDNLLINLLPQHPQVKEVDKKIANLRDEMLNQLKTKLNGLTKRLEFTDSEMARLNKRIEGFPRAAVELSRLERDVKVNNDLYTMLKSRYQEVLIREAEKVEEVSIVRTALEPTAPKNPPRTVANTALGVFIGLVFGLVFAFIFESMDTSIGAIEDVEEFLKTPVLGVIPNIDRGEVATLLKVSRPDLKDKDVGGYLDLISHFIPDSIASEGYRSLRTNVMFLGTDSDIRTMMVTSSSPTEGKTITTLNLAITIAQMGRRVLLVDADFRNPVIHERFGLDRAPGLSDAILGNYRWEDVVRNITDIMLGGWKVEDVLTTPGLDNISIITSGTYITQPSEFLNSSKVIDIIKGMRENYDFVLFDTPPVLPVADAVILGGKMDGVLIVYKVGSVARSALKRAKFVLDSVGAKVLGLVLNGLKPEVSPDFYHVSYQYHKKQEEAPQKPHTLSPDRFYEGLANRLSSWLPFRRG
mgnify:CR=1 FL=1